MKITGGEACGRSIDIPAHPGVRPTGSLMREALFNVLGKLVENSHFLDLFAGSGLIGFEALSRGASFLTVVEKTPACVETIRANALKLGYENKTKIIQTDFRKAIKSLNADQFNIIFADPPYMSDHCKLVTKLVAEMKLLKVNGLLIVEHSKDVSVEPEDRTLRLIECRPYGQSAFSFFVQKEPREPRENADARASRERAEEIKNSPQSRETSNLKAPRENRDTKGFGHRGPRPPREGGDNINSRGPRSFRDNRGPRPPKEGEDNKDSRGPRPFADNRGPKALREDRDRRRPRGFGNNRGPKKPRNDKPNMN